MARTDRLAFTAPSLNVLKTADDIAKEAERAKANELEGWTMLLTDNDVSTRSDLFANPIERFIAKTDYNHTILGYLVENRLESDGCLVYVLNKDEVWTTVYVYEYKTNHQARRLRETFVTRYGDWRLVPDSVNRCRNEVSIRMKCAWELWVFHHYFGFPWFPEGSY